MRNRIQSLTHASRVTTALYSKKGTQLYWIPEEAWAGFEPAHTGVADHCLTTWLPRHIILDDPDEN